MIISYNHKIINSDSNFIHLSTDKKQRKQKKIKEKESKVYNILKHNTTKTV